MASSKSDSAPITGGTLGIFHKFAYSNVSHLIAHTRWVHTHMWNYQLLCTTFQICKHIRERNHSPTARTLGLVYNTNDLWYTTLLSINSQTCETCKAHCWVTCQYIFMVMDTPVIQVQCHCRLNFDKFSCSLLWNQKQTASCSFTGRSELTHLATLYTYCRTQTCKL